MSAKLLCLYLTTIFVASIIPGPSMLLALTHGGLYGVRRTIASAMGNVTVTVLQAVISGIGLGTVLMASESAFQLIKWGGAAYLIYMGIATWRLPVKVQNSKVKDGLESKMTLSGMYWQAAIVTAGNPKAVLFFTAIFPQFIQSESSFVRQLLILMGIGAVVAFGCFMMYAVGGNKMMNLFSKAPTRKRLNRIIGSTFIGSGISLAVSRR